PGKGTSIHEKLSQAGFENGPRPDRTEPATGGRRTTLGYRAGGSYRLGIENQRGTPRRDNFGSLLRAGKQAHVGAPCAPPLRGGAVYRLVSFGRRAIDDHYFWPGRREKRSQAKISRAGGKRIFSSGCRLYRADPRSKRQRIQPDLSRPLTRSGGRIGFIKRLEPLERLERFERPFSYIHHILRL